MPALGGAAAVLTGFFVVSDLAPVLKSNRSDQKIAKKKQILINNNSMLVLAKGLFKLLLADFWF